MKKLFNIFFAMGLTALLLLTACKKDEVRSVYGGSTTVTLTSTTTTLNLLPADSSNEAVKFSWTDPNYQVNGERASLKVTYTLEIDTAGGNFVKPIVANVVNLFELKYSVKEFNALLIKYGLKPGKTYTLNTRLSSSLYWTPSKSTSNTVNIAATPYAIKPTPKFEVPDNLFIVGSATAGAWSNPVPVPTQQLTKIDEFTFGIIIQLTGGQHYLLLPVNGSWDRKYGILNKDDPAFQAGGDLIENGGQDIPAPATGLYKIVVNFVTGSYTVTSIASDPTPAGLFLVGDATPGGWSNPVPVPSQQFTKTSNNGFTLTVQLAAGKFYLFLPNNGSWDHKYAVADKTNPDFKEGGPFLTDAGQDVPSPDEDGTYKIEVEFVTRTYRVTKQ
jgi:starch-binding outer membrane protein SusE/F